MATSGELIKAVAAVSALPETTVATYFRSLREAEPRLVSTGGRGPSAAKMTFTDGAALLTAVLGSRFERDPAEKIVRDFQRIQASDSFRKVDPDGEVISDIGRWAVSGFQLPTLTDLAPGHSFIEALAALLEIASRDGFDRAGASLSARGRTSCFISVSVQGPRPAASILLTLIVSGAPHYEERVEYELAEEMAATEGTFEDTQTKLIAEFGDGDLKLTRRVSERTIMGVAKVIGTGKDLS